MEPAFAHDIDDVPTLRLIADLAAVSERRQHELLLSTAAAPAAREHILTAISVRCATDEMAIRSHRALVMVANTWSLASHDPHFPGLAERVTTAIGALAARDSVDRSDVDAALAPFALRLENLQSAVPAAGPPCANPNVDATALDVRDAPYPDGAQVTRTTGRVGVKVLLDANGLVRSASLYKAHGIGLDIDDFSRSAIFAAAASTYRPEVANCRPVSATYVFTVEFTNK
jgi:hypothetical protein